MSNDYLAGADGIRGIAVLIVLAVHSITIFFPETMPYLMGVGKTGVWLFFVLSAFLLSKRFMRGTTSWGDLESYFVGRFLRIIPIFAIALIIHSFIGYFTLSGAFKMLTFQRSFAHLWTIPVEFKFYFLLPFITMMATAIYKKGGALRIIKYAVIAILAHQLIFPFWKLEGNSTEMIWYIPSFLCGIVLSILHENEFKIPTIASFYIAPLVLVAIALSAPGTLHAIFGVEMTDYLLMQHIPLSILWCIFIMSLIHATGIWGRIVSSAVLRKLGAWSFSIYLFHYVILLKGAEFFPQSHIAMYFSFLVSILIGFLSYHFIETRLERFRRKFTRRYYPAKESVAN